MSSNTVTLLCGHKSLQAKRPAGFNPANGSVIEVTFIDGHTTIVVPPTLFNFALTTGSKCILVGTIITADDASDTADGAYKFRQFCVSPWQMCQGKLVESPDGTLVIECTAWRDKANVDLQAGQPVAIEGKVDRKYRSEGKIIQVQRFLDFDATVALHQDGKPLPHASPSTAPTDHSTVPPRSASSAGASISPAHTEPPSAPTQAATRHPEVANEAYPPSFHLMTPAQKDRLRLQLAQEANPAPACPPAAVLLVPPSPSPRPPLYPRDPLRALAPVPPTRSVSASMAPSVKRAAGKHSNKPPAPRAATARGGRGSAGRGGAARKRPSRAKKPKAPSCSSDNKDLSSMVDSD